MMLSVFSITRINILGSRKPVVEGVESYSSASFVVINTDGMIMATVIVFANLLPLLISGLILVYNISQKCEKMIIMKKANPGG